MSLFDILLSILTVLAIMVCLFATLDAAEANEAVRISDARLYHEQRRGDQLQERLDIATARLTREGRVIPIQRGPHPIHDGRADDHELPKWWKEWIDFIDHCSTHGGFEVH